MYVFAFVSCTRNFLHDFLFIVTNLNFTCMCINIFCIIIYITCENDSNFTFYITVEFIHKLFLGDRDMSIKMLSVVVPQSFFHPVEGDDKLLCYQALP